MRRTTDGGHHQRTVVGLDMRIYYTFELEQENLHTGKVVKVVGELPAKCWTASR